MSRRKTSKDGIIHRFKVYPKWEAPYWWFDVLVFESDAAFSRYLEIPKGKIDAYTRLYAEDPNSRCLGDMSFKQSRLENDVVSHECLHAVLAWRRKLTGGESVLDLTSHDETRVSESEEDLCYALGTLTQAVTDQLVSLRLAQL